MSETNHRESELVLGGQNSPPINAAILGGEAGKKRQLANEWLSWLYGDKVGLLELA